LILFDEVNTVISETSQQALRHVRTLLRKLVDECHLNIVCIGLGEVHGLLAGDSQLTGRGGLPNHIVKPYSWDSEEERRLFRLLCDELDRRLPFDRRSKFGDPWFAERLFLSSGGGIVGRLTDFIYSAGCSALNDGAEGIEIGHLAEAHERIMNKEHTFNPWVHDLSMAPKDSKSLLAGRHPRDVFKKKGK
jgi:hypothetical protein